MTRLSARLLANKQSNQKSLICYVVAGDPSLERTKEIVLTLDRAGVDAIELGIPFSDPLADGPTIQAASQRSLDRGTTVRRVLSLLAEIRAESKIPIVLMTYFNPIMHYGLEKFAADAVAAGADGTIVTDLTPEEANEWIGISRETGLDTVFLLAPTSTLERIAVVGKISTGFVYAVSRTGVTGASNQVPEDLLPLIAGIKSVTEVPVNVGFGVSTPDHVRAICTFADGCVVGSSLVKLIETHADAPDMLDRVYDYVNALKSATTA